MKNIVGGKEKVCDTCGGTVVYIETKLGIMTQCKECGNLSRGKLHEKVIIISYEPLENQGKCNLKYEKMNELRAQVEFGRGKRFEYKVITNNLVLIFKKGIEFYLTEEQFRNYFEVC